MSSPLFNRDEKYFQFVISRRVIRTSEKLVSTQVCWVPSRLVDAELRVLLDSKKINNKKMHEDGYYIKLWIEKVWALMEAHEGVCVHLRGRDLTKADGCDITVDKQ
jgi:hypothetical protein